MVTLFHETAINLSYKLVTSLQSKKLAFHVVKKCVGRFSKTYSGDVNIQQVLYKKFSFRNDNYSEKP